MKLKHLIDQAAGQPKKTVAVAVAEDHEVIEAVAKAIQLQLAQFRLYGNQEKLWVCYKSMTYKFQNTFK